MNNSSIGGGGGGGGSRLVDPSRMSRAELIELVKNMAAKIKEKNEKIKSMEELLEMMCQQQATTSTCDALPPEAKPSTGTTGVTSPAAPTSPVRSLQMRRRPSRASPPRKSRSRSPRGDKEAHEEVTRRDELEQPKDVSVPSVEARQLPILLPPSSLPLSTSASTASSQESSRRGISKGMVVLGKPREGEPHPVSSSGSPSESGWFGTALGSPTHLPRTSTTTPTAAVVPPTLALSHCMRGMATPNTSVGEAMEASSSATSLLLHRRTPRSAPPSPCLAKTMVPTATATTTMVPTATATTTMVPTATATTTTALPFSSSSLMPFSATDAEETLLHCATQISLLEESLQRSEEGRRRRDRDADELEDLVTFWKQEAILSRGVIHALGQRLERALAKQDELTTALVVAVDVPFPSTAVSLLPVEVVVEKEEEEEKAKDRTPTPLTMEVTEDIEEGIPQTPPATTSHTKSRDRSSGLHRDEETVTSLDISDEESSEAKKGGNKEDHTTPPKAKVEKVWRDMGTAPDTPPPPPPPSRTTEHDEALTLSQTAPPGEEEDKEKKKPQPPQQTSTRTTTTTSTEEADSFASPLPHPPDVDPSFSSSASSAARPSWEERVLPTTSLATCLSTSMAPLYSVSPLNVHEERSSSRGASGTSTRESPTSAMPTVVPRTPPHTMDGRVEEEVEEEATEAWRTTTLLPSVEPSPRILPREPTPSPSPSPCLVPPPSTSLFLEWEKYMHMSCDPSSITDGRGVPMAVEKLCRRRMKRLAEAEREKDHELHTDGVEEEEEGALLSVAIKMQEEWGDLFQYCCDVKQENRELMRRVKGLTAFKVAVMKELEK